jgi:hypothetical protein
MSGEKLRNILPVSMLAMAFFVWLQGAGAQESWQPADGGASAWGARMSAATAQTPGTSHFTGGGEWAAGKASFGLEKQPGGVWADGAGLPTSISALPAGVRVSKAKALALGTNPLIGLQKPAEAQKLPALGLTPMPAAGHTPIRQNKAQSSHTYPGRHSAVRTQFHMQYGRKAATFKFPSSRPTFASSQGGNSSGKSSGNRTEPGSPFGSSNESTGVPNPLDDSSSRSGLGTGGPTDLGQDLH